MSTAPGLSFPSFPIADRIQFVVDYDKGGENETEKQDYEAGSVGESVVH